MTPEVLIALFGLIATLVGTLGVTVLTNHYTKKREQDQWQRQLKEQRREERFAVCEQFATAAWLMATRQNQSGDEAARALHRLRLRTSDETYKAAMKLYQACFALSQQVKVAPSDTRERKKWLDEVHQQSDEFLKVAAREEES